MERLASINPLVKPEPRRTHKTACGTIMAGTILPAFVILYSLLWLRAFYANGDGSIETTTILPIDFTMGIRMDNRVDHLDPRPSGQKFKCTAASGCWYTVFFDPVDVNVPDGKCPPRQVKQGIAFSAAEAAQNFAGVNAGAPGAGDTVPPNQAPTINKKCAYAAPGELLAGGCLYYTPDPIDSFTVVWQDDGTPGSKTGVVMVTEYTKFEGGRVARAAVTERGDDDQSWEERAQGVLSGWGFKEEGGGLGYAVKNAAIALHYGDVSLQIVESYYERMSPKTNATQLVPTYLNTNEAAPESTNICYNSGAGRRRELLGLQPVFGKLTGSDLTQNGKCTDDPSNSIYCRQLKLKPAPLTVKDVRYTATPWSQLVVVLGGTISLILLVLNFVHSVLIVLCGNKMRLCTPMAAPVGKLSDTNGSHVSSPSASSSALAVDTHV